MSAEAKECADWLEALLAVPTRVVLPEIADYEVRRELLRGNKTAGLRRLDDLCARLLYVPLNTAAMRQAATFWAIARQRGYPTAADKALDGDVILAGQAVTLGEPNVVVATTNVGHLSRFVAAELWRNI